jgi:hypothetical protein
VSPAPIPKGFPGREERGALGVETSENSWIRRSLPDEFTGRKPSKGKCVTELGNFLEAIL